MTKLTSKTIAELRDGIRSGDFSAREVAESFNAAVAAAKFRFFIPRSPGSFYQTALKTADSAAFLRVTPMFALAFGPQMLLFSPASFEKGPKIACFWVSTM